MKIAIIGLGHLGMTTATCMATRHNVIAFDEIIPFIDADPNCEPGLPTLMANGIECKNLKMTTDKGLLRKADVVWICIDTPVDENDIADDKGTVVRIFELMPYLKDDVMILVSSQLPVGAIAKIEKAWAYNKFKARFAAVPENLRRGKAVDTFMNPDRIVVGVRSDADREFIQSFWPFDGKKMEWMSVESAEMTKHALNAFLATSIVFTNEIAKICKFTMADPRQVERGLRTDSRVGHFAYVRAGEAFTGGTLGRDLRYLQKMEQGGLFTLIHELNKQHLDQK